ncbi:DUF120 domain-containing protein [Singulisphaera rosea]
MRAIMGWDDVFPGTLNLTVAERHVEDLLLLKEVYFEQPETINYPTPSRIPQKRGGYNYYRCSIGHGDRTESGLIRRAASVPLRSRLEIFASLKLRDALAIVDGDEIEVEVVSDHHN